MLFCFRLKTNSYILTSFGKKLALSFAMVAITLGSFATLGASTFNREKPRKKLLTNPTTVKPGSFSLQSGYSFRGNQVITHRNDQFINMNTVVTFQQGRTTYVMPVKKKVSLNLGSQNQVKGATLNISF